MTMTTDIDKAAQENWQDFISSERLWHSREDIYTRAFRAGAEWREGQVSESDEGFEDPGEWESKWLIEFMQGDNKPTRYWDGGIGWIHNVEKAAMWNSLQAAHAVLNGLRVQEEQKGVYLGSAYCAQVTEHGFYIGKRNDG